MKNIAIALSLFTAFSGSVMAETLYNGDVVQGRKVITQLDVSDFDNNTVNELFFRAGDEINTGQYYYVPVSVLKGKNPGKSVMFVAGVHANEMNPYLTANLIKENLNTEQMSGTVTIVHQYNIPGLIANIREYVPSGPVKVNSNLNRQVALVTKKSSSQRYSYSLWNNLLKDNADYALDMHTANPTTFPLAAYSDLSIPEVKELTRLFPLNATINSSSVTSVAGAFNSIGIPAFTLEIGSREVYEPEWVEKALEGSMNLLRFSGVIKGKVAKFDDIVDTNVWVDVTAEHGGFVVPKVKVLDTVKKGDLMFVQYSAFGEQIKEYNSPADGLVIQVVQNPMAEAGSQLGSIAYFDETKSLADNAGSGSVIVKDISEKK
ncbi:succinylglutamate desuccinylase/aspartoacylase family protein [Photobacterium sp.]|uniref:succinylglutamate desuccinylase/aspartoacylase family protein n=1 Tax=Photobacterium sp. TaxID=660 RepID=UPI00299EBB46|nr:succinylglutamate desuccinylase/aspartoacylase family protein [Photobacterium sp.]MDX1301427.1 succinylglutamate desuccinylase/aspartoacylase family protein [Photobacterium sp.]